MMRPRPAGLGERRDSEPKRPPGLNFGRERPEAILDLTRVRELAEWEERDGVLRVGAGVCYTRAIAELGDALPGPGRRVAHRRLAADPQPRHDRRQPRLLLPRRRRAPAAVRLGAEVELASTRGTRRVPIGEFITGPKRNVLEPDELIAAFHVAPPAGRSSSPRSARATRW